MHYVRRRTITPPKEERGAEETKDAAPEMSPEPGPLKAHNDKDSPSTWSFDKRKAEFEKKK